MNLPVRLFWLPWLSLLALAAVPAARAAESPPPAASAEDPAIAAAVAPDAAAPPEPASGPRVVWRGDPIPVALEVEAERRIDFPEPISDLDVPRAVEQQSRIVLTPTGQLHWTARTPFAPTRVLATAASGTLYQLDVGARTGGETPERLTIADPVLDAAAAAAQATAPDERARREQAAAALIPEFLKGETGAARADGPPYVALARFALAHFTGPARLIPKLDAARVAVRPIDARAWLRVQSAWLAIRPLAQWKAGELHVTALGVTNRGSYAVPFDPRALRGALLFAAALHPTLGPPGSGHDGTVWVVVTQPPFNQALNGHGLTRAFAR